MAKQQRPVSCGVDYCSAPNLNSCLQNARESKFEFICVPLVHPQFKREFLSGKAKDRKEPFARPDVILTSSDWNNLIVGKLSPYIDVDSNIEHVFKNSQETLAQELSFAGHLCLPAITFPLKGNIQRHINLARSIYDKLTVSCSFQVWIQVPMENPLKQSLSYRDDQNNVNANIESPWEWWNGFRTVCNFDMKLGVALIVSHDLPEEEEIQRWLGEPVRCLIVPTTLFITNRKGFPVLSRAHQILIKRFSELNMQFVITGANRHENLNHYQGYLDYVWKSRSANGPIDIFSVGYEDYLQCPLQPLMDNLESPTYEVFEKDPVKYKLYQEAMEKAILDLTKDREEKEVVIMVVGAGRGPLVRASLNAGRITKRKVKVYAVEKNPNAVLTLQAMAREMWHNKVTVVSSDMREWKAPEKADILVSELLGSFGDNELSPECLDGVQRFLKDDGINIPMSYTSYIAPVQSSKLYNEVRNSKDKEKHSLAHFETPYVVHLHNKYDIAEPQSLFSFHHPNKDSRIDNTRFGKKTFRIVQDAVLHGFSGYFDAVLYDNVRLSTVPATHSPGMFSWFPIFFPIKDPVQLKSGNQISLHFWRRCSSKNVWYEWCITEPVPLSLHNPNGRSYTIGL